MKKITHFNKITFTITIICILFGTGITAVAINNSSQWQDNSEHEITVHYYNENNWENPYVYCYLNNDEEYSWPGKKMSADGNNWYSYTINGFEQVRVIFSNNGNNQIPGQNQDGYLIQGEKWYCLGSWYDHEPKNTVVHYYNSDNWSNVKLYYYQDSLNSPSWPGVSMYHEKGKWYTYEMMGFDKPKVIFSNNGSNQIPGQNQEGFSVSNEMWYKDGKWYNEDPDIRVDAVPIKVHYYNYNNWDNINIYYYNDDVIAHSWPGTPMSAEGDGWYEYEIIGLENPQVIFSNNGNSQVPSQNQEGFSVTKECWYRNGTWYEKRPNDLVVYFYKPDDWSSPYIYYYLTDNDTGFAWPGTKMTDIGNGWFKYNITKYSNAKVLFSDGSHQLPASGESGFDVSGATWLKNGNIYLYNPDNIETNETTGDLNGDGVIDENDYNLLNGYLSDNQELTPEQIKIADTNGDGIVDDKDKELLDKFIKGEITEFPANKHPVDKNVSYEYDKLGRIVKVIYDENNYVDYVYDKNGNITEVQVTGNVD